MNSNLVRSQLSENPPSLLTREETAYHLRCSTRHVSRLWKSGELQRIYLGDAAKSSRTPLKGLEVFAIKRGFTFPWMQEDAA